MKKLCRKNLKAQYVEYKMWRKKKKLTYNIKKLYKSDIKMGCSPENNEQIKQIKENLKKRLTKRRGGGIMVKLSRRKLEKSSRSGKKREYRKLFQKTFKKVLDKSGRK